MNKKTRPDLIRPRWSKVLTDLWDSKTRTLLVVASIAVGVFAIGMIATAYSILAEDINLSYASVNPVNVEIWTDPFDEEFIRTIERIPGVEDVEGRRTLGVRTSQDGVEWQSQSLVAVDDFESTKISLLRTVDGSLHPKDGELVVSTDFMNDTGYQVDDQIHVKFSDGDVEILPLVGLIGDQAGGGDPTMGAAAYTTLDTLEGYGEGDYFNRMYVTIQGDGSDLKEIEELAAQIEEKIENNRRNVYRIETDVSDQHPRLSMLLAIFGVLGALGALITILSSTLIINTLNALLNQHMRQIGVMKLVGGRSYQILGMYLLLIFAYGVIALVIAIPSGTAAGNALANFIAGMMNVNLQEFRIIPTAIVHAGFDCLPHSPGGRLLPGQPRLEDQRAAGDQQRPHGWAARQAGLAEPDCPVDPLDLAPDPALDPQYLPPARPPAADDLHPDHRRGGLYRCLQRALFYDRVYGPACTALHGRCHHQFQPGLSCHTGRESLRTCPRDRGYGILGRCRGRDMG